MSLSATPNNTLRITEIFYSLQGETTLTGLPTVFIRLTGCPLRCTYCDTSYAFKGGTTRTIDAILEEVATHPAQAITVTGGEPLAQANCIPLLKALCDRYSTVSLETSGALSVAAVDPRVIKILDIKTPSSGEMHRNDLSNIDHLMPTDQVKFVVGKRADFDWSQDFIQTHALEKRCHVLISPVFEAVALPDLAQWLLDSKLQARLQIQLHKIIWNDARGK